MNLWDAQRQAPPERLAAFRIALGVFVTSYLVIRAPVFVELGDRSSARFEPVGLFRLIDTPMAGAVNTGAVVTTILLGVAFTVGWRFRVVGPLFAVAVLVVTTHRSSWGQMLHFENLMALHSIVIGLSPAADAWSVDARRRAAALRRCSGPDFPPSERYGWPLQLASVVVVATYVITGIAKLRYGGIDWIAGDTLRNHIAYSATRLELLGGSASPFAAWVVSRSSLLPFAAGFTVLVELSAPMVLIGRRSRNFWVVAAWSLHLGIYALMLVGFPSPLFLIAFAPLFALDRVPNHVTDQVDRARRIVAPG